jgi:hypothetical protein
MIFSGVFYDSKKDIMKRNQRDQKYYPCDFGISQKLDICIGESKRFYRSFCVVSYVLSFVLL